VNTPLERRRNHDADSVHARVGERLAKFLPLMFVQEAVKPRLTILGLERTGQLTTNAPSDSF